VMGRYPSLVHYYVVFILSVKTCSFLPVQRIKALLAVKYFCSFSLMPKEMTKERAPASLGPSGTLRALKSAGSFNTQFKLLIRQISGCSATCQWELNSSPFKGLPMPDLLDPDIFFKQLPGDMRNKAAR
jgi:hypothetical protein